MKIKIRVWVGCFFGGDMWSTSNKPTLWTCDSSTFEVDGWAEVEVTHLPSVDNFLANELAQYPPYSLEASR